MLPLDLTRANPPCLFGRWLTDTHRTRNYNQPCKTTKARNGALLPTRSGPALRQPRAESAHKNFLRVLYSNQCPLPELTHLRLGTPPTRSISSDEEEYAISDNLYYAA